MTHAELLEMIERSDSKYDSYQIALYNLFVSAAEQIERATTMDERKRLADLLREVAVNIRRMQIKLEGRASRHTDGAAMP